MDEKICLKCRKTKGLNDFYKDKSRKDGLYSYCKECSKKNIKNIYDNNKQEKIKYQKQYYQEHKKEKQEYDKNYRQATKSKRNANENRLYQNNQIYRLKKQLRNCIYKSFTKKNFYKKEQTQNIIGCEYATFIRYLLQTYKDNYGIEWDGIEKVHIDHIIPLATTNDERGIIRLCHYTNLQLLKAKDNLVKSSKLNYNRGD